MTDNVIHPTHTCFDDALDLLVQILKAEPDREKRGTLVTELRLVHARCLKPSGKPWAHAWLEDLKENKAYFVGILDGERVTIAADVAEYRESVRMQDCIRYSYPEALRQNRAAGHYGPWAPHLQALCGGKEEWKSEDGQ